VLCLSWHFPAVAGKGSPCAPITCESERWDCGAGPNRCGGMLECGLCGNGQYCDGAHACAYHHGPYVDQNSCTPGREYGSDVYPYCTIQAAVDEAPGYGFHSIYVVVGQYHQNNNGQGQYMVTDRFEIRDPPGRTGIQLLGGYTDLDGVTTPIYEEPPHRTPTVSCDPTQATVIVTTTADGVLWIENENTSSFERFCILPQSTMLSTPERSLVTLINSSLTMFDCIVDATELSSSSVETRGVRITFQGGSTYPSNPIFQGTSQSFIDGGAGTIRSTGILIEAAANVRVQNYSIRGGQSPLARGIDGRSVSGTLFIDGSNIFGCSETYPPIPRIETIGVALGCASSMGTTLENSTVSGCNNATSIRAVGIWTQNELLLNVLGNNAIRGGRGVELRGIEMDRLSGTGGTLNIGVAEPRTISKGNNIDGGDLELSPGGGTPTATGVRTRGVDIIHVGENNILSGGVSPDEPTSRGILIGLDVDQCMAVIVGPNDTPNQVGNKLSGSRINPVSGQPELGGLETVGAQISCRLHGNIVIQNNPLLLGGGPSGTAGSNGTTLPRARGLVVQDAMFLGSRDGSTALEIRNNHLIQGCHPYCRVESGTNEPIITKPSQFVGIGVEIVQKLPTNTPFKDGIVRRISGGTSCQILGGPVLTPIAPLSDPPFVDYVTCAGVGAEGLTNVNGPALRVMDFAGRIQGNMEPDRVVGGRIQPKRPSNAIGIAIQDARVWIQGNARIEGGYASWMSIGVLDMPVDRVAQIEDGMAVIDNRLVTGVSWESCQSAYQGLSWQPGFDDSQVHRFLPRQAFGIKVEDQIPGPVVWIRGTETEGRDNQKLVFGGCAAPSLSHGFNAVPGRTVGVDLPNVGVALVERARIAAGVIPGEIGPSQDQNLGYWAQIGLRLWKPLRGGIAPGTSFTFPVAGRDSRHVLEVLTDSNLIEGCGIFANSSSKTNDPGSPFSGRVHHRLCDLNFDRSVGMVYSDAIRSLPEEPGKVHLHNRIFGGHAGDPNSMEFGSVGQTTWMGSSGIMVYEAPVENRPAHAWIQNIINAQGFEPSGAFAENTSNLCKNKPYLDFPDARGVDIRGQGTLSSVDEPILFFNNLIDHGGKACNRYNVYEDDSVGSDLVRLELERNNLVYWLALDPHTAAQKGRRELPPTESWENPMGPGARIWLYREFGNDSIAHCIVGNDAPLDLPFPPPFEVAGCAVEPYFTPLFCLDFAQRGPTGNGNYRWNLTTAYDIFMGNNESVSEAPGASVGEGDFDFKPYEQAIPPHCPFGWDPDPLVDPLIGNEDWTQVVREFASTPQGLQKERLTP
jgi:hypothetical protein